MPDPPHSALDVLPTNIWQKIFDNIAEHLPQVTLLDVSLTCQAFRAFSSPLIYRTLVVHPFAVNRESKQHWKRSEWYPLPPNQMDREVQRLDFYCSGPIATYVRHLELSPWQPSDMDDVAKTHVEAADDLNSLVHKFYQAVPQFTNAQSFVCVHTEIDGFALQRISQLPNLRDLDVAGCNLLSPATVSSCLRLRAFKFWHMAMPDELAAFGVDCWLPMLDPASLELVEVGPARASALFFQDIRSLGPFKSLSTLNMAIMSQQMLERMPLFISKMPALRNLDLPLFGSLPNGVGELIVEGMNPSLEPSMPNLETYCGPYELLHVILGRPPVHSTIRRLDLQSLGKGKPFSVCLQILSLPAHSLRLNNVTHFSAMFSSIEYDDLAKLCALLPHLQELELSLEFQPRSRGQKATEETFLDDVLGLSLPSQMRSLSIDWTAGASVDLDSKHRQVQAKLSTRLPLLERLWLCDWMKSAYLWHRTASGRVIWRVYETGTLQKMSEASEERRAVFSNELSQS